MRAKKKSGERERERHIRTQKEENRRGRGILERRVRDKEYEKRGLELKEDRVCMKV